MIQNLKERLEFWNERHKIKYQGNTIVDEEIIKRYAKESSVLEIGPGEGRQFKIAYPLSKQYTIIDISSKVIENPIYSKVHKILIENFNLQINKTFDFIHFWYLLHHIMKEEDSLFFSFITKHCNKDTIVAFNFSEDLNKKFVQNNGIKTTNRSKEYVNSLLKKNNFSIIESKKVYKNNVIRVCKYNG